jgi:hypothetical protein
MNNYTVLEKFLQYLSAGERNFATLGQNERPREKQTKTGPAKKLHPFIKIFKSPPHMPHKSLDICISL